MNINIIESEPTFAKGSEITLLDVLDPNVESLEQCEWLIVSSRSEVQLIFRNVVLRNSYTRTLIMLLK